LNYSKEQIQSLIQDLYGYDGKYDVLADFLEHHVSEGRLEFGLVEPGSSGSAMVVYELEEAFPDILRALRMPSQELMLYLDAQIGLEYPIACWRLRVGL